MIHNPDIGWETADEYLYGNVRDKLKLSGGDIKAVQGDSGHAQADMVTEVWNFHKKHPFKNFSLANP